MGTTLAHLLRTYQKGFQPKFGACYLNPPVGDFVAHETTTNKNVRVLPSHWSESWCQGGTRRDDASEHWYDRNLCYYTEKGNPERIDTVVPNDDPEMWWKSKAHENHPDEGLGVQFWHLSMHLQDRESACSWVSHSRLIRESRSSSEKVGVAVDAARPLLLPVTCCCNVSNLGRACRLPQCCWRWKFEVDRSSS